MHVDPVQHGGDPGVDPGVAGVSAAIAPGDDTGQGVVVVVSGSSNYQGASTVALDNECRIRLALQFVKGHLETSFDGRERNRVWPSECVWQAEDHSLHFLSTITIWNKLFPKITLAKQLLKIALEQKVQVTRAIFC